MSVVENQKALKTGSIKTDHHFFADRDICVYCGLCYGEHLPYSWSNATVLVGCRGLKGGFVGS